MGWCRGTSIFDGVVSDLLKTESLSDKDFNRIVYNLALDMEDMDWDCQCESNYYTHPKVMEVFKELGHEYWEDE